MSKTEDKAYIEDWETYKKSVIASTYIDVDESYASQQRRIEALKGNTEKWFNYYFPLYTTASPAPFHLAATKRVTENAEWYEVRMWSRELAKTTRTMMEVLYLCLNAKKKYVLLISNSFDNATRLLMHYKVNLEHNQRILKDYGRQEKPGSWQAGEFITNDNVAFRALGAGQSPRGTRNEEMRPDVLLFDDLDTDQDCRNPETIKKTWKWVEEAAIGTRSVSNPTLIIFCGNRIATDCCVVRAACFADHTDIINIRDEHGNSIWPQKNTEMHIDRVLGQKSYAAAQKEYFNNPVTEGSVFKQMAYKGCPPLSEYSMLVCYTDPSFKHARTNDYKATILVGKWRDEFHIVKAFLEQTTTATMVAWHYQIMDLVGMRACYYYIEQSFFQDILAKEFYEAGSIKGRTIPILGDKRQKPDKFTRIESLLEPLNSNGKLYLNAHEKENPHMQRLEEQFLAIGPGSRAHDDGPDAVEGAVWIINQKILAREPDNIMTFARKSNKYY